MRRPEEEEEEKKAVQSEEIANASALDRSTLGLLEEQKSQCGQS